MWVHVLPGRARARVAGLKGSPGQAAALERRLAGRPGIRAVRANCVTGTVLILYAPAVVCLSQLESALFAGNVGAAEAAAASEPSGLFAANVGASEVAAAAEPSGLYAANVGEATGAGLSTAVLPAAGLSTSEVERRRHLVGSNRLLPPPRPGFLQRLLRQYRDTMQLTLLGGAGLALLSGHRRDALTIGAVLLLNGIIGAMQDNGEAGSYAAMAAMTSRTARVIRDGAEQTVDAQDLVPGDLLLLEAGDRIPADAAVTSAAALAVDESLLTGECAAADKCTPGAVLAAGSAVVRGRGRAVVTATGMNGSLGRIAGLLCAPAHPAPLQQHLDGLGRRIARWGLLAAAGVAAAGLLRGQGLATALTSGIGLAISAVPEGLPTFVTLALAAGARRMAGRGAAFRTLPAVETMGNISLLCCDKTGTLTTGQMVLREVQLPTARWEISGDGYAPAGTFRKSGRPAEPLTDPGLRLLLMTGALCGNARLTLDAQGALVTHGDPTEVALLVGALKAGLRAAGGEGRRLAEQPFDSERRRMSVTVADAAGHALTCTKGAPEALLPCCSRIFTRGAVRKLDGPARRRILRDAADMATRGLRVLALAYRPAADPVEVDLIFLGLAGLVDPLRPEAPEAVRRCRDASIRMVMITGDHPATAACVARQAGVTGALLTGDQLAVMTDAELAVAAADVGVVARAAPEQKLRVVRALRQAGHTVAMAGDGVNDAPAMRAADIGIAMGDGGTEVARATAGLILEDDNLLTLLRAVEQGRATRSNIRRTARYLLGSNAAEVCLMGAALLLGLPLPLLPVQLLWMNLAGDGLPAIALGDQPPAPHVMAGPPERGGALLGADFNRQVVGHGLRKGLAATGLYAWALAAGRSLPQARTLAMGALAVGQIRHLRACAAGPAAGRPAAGGGQAPGRVRTAGRVAGALALAAIYLPPLRGALQFAPVGIGDLALAAAVGYAAQ